MNTASLVLVWTILVAAQQRDEKIKISGFVRDANGKVIHKATILVHLSAKPGKPIVLTTDEKGKYEAVFESSGPFHLFYSHNEGGKAQVSRLSGSHSQDISIVLHVGKQMKMMSAIAIFEEIQACEFASFLFSNLPEVDPLAKELHEKFKGADTRDRLEAFARVKLKDEPITKAIQEKAKQVLKTYYDK